MIRPTRVREVLRISAVTAGAVSIGAGSAIQPVVAGGAAAAGSVVAVALLPASWLLGAVLVVRNVTDPFAEFPLARTGLNAGAALGLVVIAGVAIRPALRRTTRGILWTVAAIAVLAFWFVVGVLVGGPDPSLLREFVRVISILAMFCFALNSGSSLKPRRAADVVILTALIPAGAAVYAFVTNLDANPGYRAAGTIAHANSAAPLLVIGALVTIWRLVDSRGGNRYWLSLALFVGAILATRSITGVAEAAAGVGCYWLLRNNLGTRRPGSGVRSGLPVIVLVLLVAAFLVTPLGGGRMRQLGSTAPPDVAARGFTTNSLDWRFYNWNVLLDAWRRRPLFGYGLGSTAKLVQPGRNLPHNEYVRVLVETGAVGIGIASLVLLALFRRLLRALQADRRGLALPVMCASVALSVGALTQNTLLYTAPMYSFAALAGVVLRKPVSASSVPAPVATRSKPMELPIGTRRPSWVPAS